MNILMALSQLEVTGAEVYGTTLSDELIKGGNRVYIVSDTLTKETKAEYFKIEFNKRSMKNRIDQVRTLLKIIREKDIHVVHAHSRASAWSSAIACKIAGIPLITTIHGRQPVHLSRKIVKGFGDYSLAVCENICEHVVRDLGVNKNKIEVLRNPIDYEHYNFIGQKPHEHNKKIISIIGRLSGPKGDVTYKLLDILYKRGDFEVQVIGGKDIPERFRQFTDRVKFLGYVNNVNEKIKDSHVIIGAGRVAVEGILSGKPTIAIGEATSVGLMTREKIDKGLSSNFGDINITNSVEFHWGDILRDIDLGLNLSNEELLDLRNRLIEEFSLEKIVRKIELTYEKLIVKKRKWEMPVIMYHRVIENESEGGVHGTHVTIENFRKQMEYLKNQGYQTVTFEDLLNNNYKKRFDRENKWIMLTFDDGYKDNYTNAFPILKEYGFKCTIYLVSHLQYNKWDVDVPENPEKEFTLMNLQELKELREYGIEFGGHTMNHPRLTRLSLEEVEKEIFESKKVLEERLGERLVSFAYPYGDLNKEITKIPKKVGYDFAVATDSGSIIFSEDLYEIRRIGIFPTNNMFNYKRKVSGYYNFIKIKRELKEIKNNK